MSPTTDDGRRTDRVPRGPDAADAAESAVLHPAPRGPVAWWAGPLGLVLAAALCVAALIGPWPLAAAVLAVQAVIMIGWLEAIGAPGGRGAQVVVLAVAGAADLVLVVPSATRPGLVLAPLGLSVLAVVAHQLARRGGRLRVVRSLTATSSAAVLVALVAMLIPLPRLDSGDQVVIAGLLAAGLCALVVPLPVPGWSTAVLSVGVGAACAAGVGAVGSLGVVRGAALGACAALAAAVGAGVARVAARNVPALAAALPLTTAAPVVYLLGRALLG